MARQNAARQERDQAEAKPSAVEEGSETQLAAAPKRASAASISPIRRTPDRQRLVVELGRQASNALDDLVDLDGLNKTTVVNRALQAYAFLRKAEQEGAKIMLLEDGAKAPERIRFV